MKNTIVTIVLLLSSFSANATEITSAFGINLGGDFNLIDKSVYKIISEGRAINKKGNNVKTAKIMPDKSVIIEPFHNLFVAYNLDKGNKVYSINGSSRYMSVNECVTKVREYGQALSIKYKVDAQFFNNIFIPNKYRYDVIISSKHHRVIEKNNKIILIQCRIDRHDQKYNRVELIYSDFNPEYNPTTGYGNSNPGDLPNTDRL